jgi:hypothetical protein
MLSVVETVHVCILSGCSVVDNVDSYDLVCVNLCVGTLYN